MLRGSVAGERRERGRPALVLALPDPGEETGHIDDEVIETADYNPHSQRKQQCADRLVGGA